MEGLKFDLRLYVLLTSINPMRIFLYKDGLARFATRKYDANDPNKINDLYMHLTNYSINKFNKDFVFNTDNKSEDVGHKQSVSAVFNVN